MNMSMAMNRSVSVDDDEASDREPSGVRASGVDPTQEATSCYQVPDWLIAKSKADTGEGFDACAEPTVIAPPPVDPSDEETRNYVVPRSAPVSRRAALRTPEVREGPRSVLWLQAVTVVLAACVLALVVMRTLGL